MNAPDRYTQTTLLSVEPREIVGELELAPGNAAWPVVMSSIDSNGDGRLDGPEMQAYARVVLGDLSLQVNEAPVALELRSIEFSPLESFQEGGGTIRVAFATARLQDPPASLEYSNRHELAASVYSASLTTGRDSGLAVRSATASEDQSRIEASFTHVAEETPWTPPAALWLAVPLAALAIVALWRLQRRGD